MPVAPIAMLFGVLLTVLGLILYGTSELDPKPITALIPSALGLALVLLGQIARGASERGRMHTMHAAALIGLIGLIGGVVLTVIDVSKLGNEPPPSNRAMAGKAAMALLCAVFLGLCVKSFIDVRRARKQRAASSERPA
jgi:hypothetical protein